jgi:hypothetical protein
MRASSGPTTQKLALLFVARALALHHHVDAVIGEDVLEQRHVGEARHVFQDQRIVGEQARDHQRQRRVLRAGNRNRAVKRLAADDANTVHESPRLPGRRPVYPLSLSAAIPAES